MVSAVKKVWWLGAVILWASVNVHAAPFAKTVHFTQPDGAQIAIWGEGDEFRAVFEHNGYTVVCDPATRTYMYARLSADGSELIPTRLVVGRDDPVAGGLPQHLRIAEEAARANARARFAEWDAGMQTTRRWREQKGRLQAFRAQAADGRIALAPPSSPTLGTKAGLCLLIDFDDDPATIPQAEIVSFCNADNYTGYGNNGSVKKYFQDVSNGLLIYTNIVTAYIRIPNALHSKSYYNDITKGAGQQGNLLIKDALDILKASPDYETDILPLFDWLTVDGAGNAIACNVLYAGGNGGVWDMGLWPHASTLSGAYDLGGGRKVWRYQITDISNSLELGTFCHENGHLLCGYPDLYDYDYDSEGGAGDFCLMNSGGHGVNPAQVCAYLKYASGWTTTVEVERNQYLPAELTAPLGSAGFNHFYRYAKPGAPTEYYLFENRQKSGRDAGIPASGIAIWHIDEEGDRDDQRMAYNTEHQNYECTLVQADNLWHFQKYTNSGDANDLYYLGNSAVAYVNRFSDATAPSARWWDGSASELKMESFSASAAVMTFVFQVSPPVIVTPSPLPDGRVGTYYSQALMATYGVSPYEWALLSGVLPDGLGLTTDGNLSGLPEAPGTFDFQVTATGVNGLSATNQFNVTILPAAELPFTEPFEDGAAILNNGWTQEFVTNTLGWAFQDGNKGSSSPLSAHGGTNNACLKAASSSPHVTRLVTPRLLFPPDARLPRLRFWHYMAPRSPFQDRLRVYYKTDYAGEWILLAEYTSAVNVWTERVLDLPETSAATYLAFEGDARYGYGVHIDDIVVSDEYQPFEIVSPETLPAANMLEPYLYALQAAGGFGPYLFAPAPGAMLPGNLALATNGVISGIATNAGTYAFSVDVTDLGDTDAVMMQTRTFSLEVGLPRVELFSEGFEYGGLLPPRWREEKVTNNVSWAFLNGGGNGDTFHQPVSAYAGNYNAVLWAANTSNQTTRLVMKEGVNLGSAPATPRLEFWHCMTAFQSYQDELRVYGKAGVTEPWQLLATYTNSVTAWTQRVLPILSPSTNYFVAFEGTAQFGHGVCIDNVRITDGSLAPIITTQRWLPGGWVGRPYSQTLTAVGGKADYTWEIVSGTLPAGLALAADGTLSGTPQQNATALLSIRVTGADGHSSTNVFELTVSKIRLPFAEGGETGAVIPFGWTQAAVAPSSDKLKWLVGAGSPSGTPSAAHSGTNNFYLRQSGNNSRTIRLMTPELDMGNATNAVLSFWLCMPKTTYQNQLKVMYATNAVAPVWNELVTISAAVPAWSNVVVTLPSTSSSCVIAFDGTIKGTDGICIDDIAVTGAYLLAGYDLWADEVFGGETEGTGRDDDFDGDGVSNVWEYIHGTDPTDDADGAQAVIGIQIENGTPAITFPFGKAAEGNGVTWWLETCTDLLSLPLTWETVDGTHSATDQGAWWRIVYDTQLPVTNAPRRFFRLNALVP
jgi:M6 family metalloprotease-like protein